MSFTYILHLHYDIFRSFLNISDFFLKISENDLLKCHLYLLFFFGPLPRFMGWGQNYISALQRFFWGTAARLAPSSVAHDRYPEDCNLGPKVAKFGTSSLTRS